MALNFILLWIISFIFMQFNNDAQHPPLPYIGWSYIALAVYFFETKSKFFMPQKRHFFYAAVVIGFSYTRSGQLKYLDSIWRSGEAFSFILEKYNSVRPFWTTNHRLLPREISIALNYLTLVVQLTAFFAAFHPITRAISSLALIIMHFFAFIFFNLTQVSLGMICIHLLWIDLNGLKLVIKYISGLRLTITN